MTRINYCLNPSFEVDVASWDAGLTRVTTEHYTGIAAAQGTVSTATLNFAYGFASNAKTAASVPVTPGEVWTISLYSKATTTSLSMGIRTIFMNSGGTFVSDTGNPLTSTVTTTGWTRVSATVTIPASVAWMGFSPVGSSQSVYIDAVLCEKVSTTGFYFDGTTANSTWSGTAHNSTSTYNGSDGWRTNLFKNASLEVNVLQGSNATQAASTTNGVIAGTKSLGVTPNAGTNDSYLDVNLFNTIYAGIKANTTYTISGYLTLTAPLTTTLHATRALGIVVIMRVGAGSYTEVRTNQPSNTAGTTRVSVTFTTPVGMTEMFIRLYNGASNGGGTVYYDAILLEESATMGDYFDGATAPSGGLTREWTGTGNDSPSIEYTVPVTTTVAIKHYESGAFVARTAVPKVRVSGAWVVKRPKRWNGSAWVDLA